MKKTMKAVVCLAMCAVLLFALTACGGSKTAVKSIGINQYGEHASLDNCRIGFLQGLKEAGLEEGKDFTVDYQNAGFDDTVNAQIAASFAANNVDMMVAIATPSAVACFSAAEDKDIPVVFSAISDPVSAGLAEGNITGTSDKLPVEAQLDLIRTLQPDAKTIGIIYTTSEANSVSTIAEYQEKAPSYGFTIDAIGVTAQSEVTQAVDTLLSRNVDLLNNLTDNNVVGVLPAILEKTNEAKIPVYGSEVEQVKIGCVAAAGIDYVQLGIQTGKMAARVLKGEITCANLPFETISEYGIYVNSAALAEMGIALPASVAEKAVESNAA
ncbi:MAG: ABC transporter substrate-binding protein [Oscillospiraceae bacterium]|nr:ABC transporter substrate-binding protein [Oscillospiraceae bacterium]